MLSHHARSLSSTPDGFLQRLPVQWPSWEPSSPPHSGHAPQTSQGGRLGSGNYSPPLTFSTPITLKM
jgi:hypothetical protein